MITVSQVDQTIANDETWQFAFQFGDLTDETWSFDHKELYSDVKSDAADATPLLSTSSLNGRIVITDTGQRIMNYYVPPDEIQAALPAGKYVYDLVMVDQTTFDTQRLMFGTLTVIEGPTKEGQP